MERMRGRTLEGLERRPVVDYLPAADMRYDHDQVVIEVDLPGVDARRDVVVDGTPSWLVVRGRRRRTPSGDAFWERWVGTFERSFHLPVEADVARRRVTCRRGVLRVVVPLRQRPRQGGDDGAGPV